jgi:accessory colonization factor AcfC
MKYMMKFTDFLITESLHIHDVMDKFTDYVYIYMKGKGVGLYEVKNNKNFDIDINYEDWIHSQGEKLSQNLFSLYDHYK